MKMTLLGDRELIAKLAKLEKQSERNKMVRPAVREAAAEIRKKARGNAPIESGLLKDSIIIKAKTKKGTAYAVVGPSNKNAGYVWRADANFGEGGWVHSNPAKYGHLVEFGTSHSAPQPFLRPAYDSTDAKGIITRRIQHELRKQAQGRVGKVKADKGIVAALRKAGGR